MRARWCAWVAVAVLGVAGPIRAESHAPRPWAIGVTDEDQARAEALFARGNGLLDQGLFPAALDVYREALAIWDHPSIRYNAAVAFINLERQIDAYAELEQALRFGTAALEPEIHEQALAYQRLLHAQIVHLTVACVDAGTRISLDGKELQLACPGASTLRILPGRHRLIAEAPGSLTRTIELVPSGGDTPRETIDLMTNAEATIHRRRWATWKPWVVLGTGAAIALVGGAFELQAAADFRSYDKAVAVLCARMSPCDLPPNVTDALAAGRRENRVAIGLFVAGGATLAAGALTLWLNRSIARRLGYDDGGPTVSASFGDGASITAGMAF